MTQLSEQQQERYVRNLLVEDFTQEQQEKLLNGRVLVIGAGGLGSAVLHYLAAAGIGRLGIADSDIVSLSNLQRQVLYTEKDLGHPKAECAARRVKLINSNTNTDVYNFYITVENASQIIKEYDLTVDCSDNYPTRYLVDKICREFSIPFIYGSAEQTQGQVSVFNYGQAGSYIDLFPQMPRTQKSPVGVLSPLPGIVGSIQALEAIKLLTGYGSPLAGKLLTIDGKTNRFTLFDL